MLNIPHVDRKNFSKHFIKNVLVELRYVPINLSWASKRASFGKIAQSLGLPSVKDAQETEIKLVSRGKNKRVSQQVEIRSNVLGLSAHSQDGMISLQIHRDRIVFSTQQYQSFEIFWSLISNAVLPISKLFGINEFNWLGIRKIDELGINSPDGGYRGEGCNPVLFTPFRNETFGPLNIRSGDCRYAVSDDVTTCVVGARVIKDAEPKLYTLQLDFDANRKLGVGVNFEKLKENAEELNRIHFDLFCWATDPSLIKELE